jgi:hypothetical protein
MMGAVVCRLRPVKEMAQSHEYLSIEYSEEEVWLTWTDKNNEHHEKSVRQLAQEARAGNAHDENVLSYYRCRFPHPMPGGPSPEACSSSLTEDELQWLQGCSCLCRKKCSQPSLSCPAQSCPPCMQHEQLWVALRLGLAQ